MSEAKDTGSPYEPPHEEPTQADIEAMAARYKLEAAAAAVPVPAVVKQRPRIQSIHDLLITAEDRLAFAECVLPRVIQLVGDRGFVNFKAWDEDAKQKIDVPYLAGDAACKLILPFGLSATIHDVRRENYEADDFGPHYAYIATGDISLGDIRVEGIEGTCWSRKPLFFIKNKQPRQPHEINPMDIRADARTDFFRLAVSTILGLRNITWEQLGAAGLDLEKVRGVTYETKAATKEAAKEANNSKRVPAPSEGSPASAGALVAAAARRLGSPEAAEKELMRFCATELGYENWKEQLTRGDLKTITEHIATLGEVKK